MRKQAPWVIVLIGIVPLGAEPVVISSPRDGAAISSGFVALTGAAPAGYCFEIERDEQPVGRACADSGGHFDKVIRVGQGNHVLRILRNAVHINANPPRVAPHVEGPWDVLQEGDVILSHSEGSWQESLYNPRYTHAALYLGAGPDGAALIAEAVDEESVGGLDEVRAVPIEQTLEWHVAKFIDVFRLKGGLPPADREAVLGFARGVVNRGLKFWTTPEEVAALYAVWLQWDAQNDRPFHAVHFQQALDRLRANKFSLDRFNCTTLVWRAFREGSKGRIDLGDPNRLELGGNLAYFHSGFPGTPSTLFPGTGYSLSIWETRKGHGSAMTRGSGMAPARLVFLSALAVAPFAVVAWQGDAPPPAVAKDGVVNSASQMPPEFGGGQIARGSLFRIRGWRLGPETQIRSEKLPLAAALAGMSVEIRGGGARVNAFPVSVSGNEIEAVLPSDAPLGKAELIVLKDGDPSPPFSIRIVESSFGAFSVNGLGWGPGKVRNGSAGDAPANSPDHPARPGETITLEGTGLGSGSHPSIMAGEKLVTRIRDAGRRSCCSAGTGELIFDLPPDTPEGCYVPLRVQSAPGVTSNVVTAAVSRDGGPCRDPGNWLPHQLDGVRRVGFAGLLHADVLLRIDRQEAAFNFDAGFAKFVAMPDGTPQIDRYYLFPPYGTCTGYSRVVHGGEIMSPFASLSAVQGVPIDAGGLLTVRGGENPRSIGLYNKAEKSFGAVLGGRSPFPGVAQSPLLLLPQTYEISGDGGEVGSFRAPVTVSKLLRWNNRARVTAIDRRLGVTVDWTPARPEDSIVITAMNINSESGALGVCECVAPARAGHFTIPAAALTNVPATKGGESLPLNLLLISEFPGQAPVPFTAPGLDRGLAFFFSTSARSVGYR